MSLFGPPSIEKMKARRDVQGLIKALSYQKDAKVRQDAARALGCLKDLRAGKPLVSALKDQDQEARRAAVEAVGEIGYLYAVDPLVALFKDDADLRGAAVEALAAIYRVPAVEELIFILGDKDKVAAKVAAQVLGKMGAAAVKPLIHHLAFCNKDEGLVVAKVLRKIGAPSVEPLIVALKDADGDARRRIIETLDHIGWQPGRDEAGAVYWIGKRSWRKCVRIGASAVGPLIAALEDEEKKFRDKALEALVEIGLPAAEPLIALLRHQDQIIREAAVGALQKIDAPSVEPLIAALRDQFWDVREAAAQLLGKIGDARAAQPLIAALHDTDSNVRWAAADALKQIGWRPGKDEAGAAFWIVKRDWKQCLKMGAPAVEPLIVELKNPAGDVRRAAAETLVKIYHLQTIDEQTKTSILRDASLITTPHEDVSSGPYDGCGNWVGRSHQDAGIGVDFPL